MQQRVPRGLWADGKLPPKQAGKILLNSTPSFRGTQGRQMKEDRFCQTVPGEKGPISRLTHLHTVRQPPRIRMLCFKVGGRSKASKEDVESHSAGASDCSVAPTVIRIVCGPPRRLWAPPLASPPSADNTQIRALWTVLPLLCSSLGECLVPASRPFFSGFCHKAEHADSDQ